MTEHAHAAWVMVSGSEGPFSVGYEKPSSTADSGFTVLCEDGPDVEDIPETGDHPGLGVWCISCLLEKFPELGPALHLARQFGAADLDVDSGEWVGRTPSHV